MQFKTIALLVGLLGGSNVMATPLAAGPKEGGKLIPFNSTAEDSTNPPGSYYCGGRWGKFTNQAVMQDAINQVRNREGLSCVGAGPSTCTTVTSGCYNGVAIAWCNDNHYGKCVLYSDLATRATYTANGCAGNPTGYTGQTFYGDTTNTIIKQC